MYKYKLTPKIQQLREEEEASKPQYTIYCDMDGVLCDFMGNPSGKVIDRNQILKDCKLEDFIIFKIESNKISGFI